MSEESSLSKEELSRYSRHILLPEIRRAGQEKIRAASVFVVGAGGLGGPVLYYLAAAGVGRITFIDDDTVDLSNLQRQILYDSEDLDAPKAYAAARRLRLLNPGTDIQALRERLDADNALELLAQADLVIETSDSLSVKFMVNDACVLLGKPVLIGGILRFEGQLMGVAPGKSSCYRCLFQEVPPAHAVPSCSEAGVLGALAGLVGSLQALEALKILTGAGEPLFGRLVKINGLTTEQRTLRLPRNPDCPVCGSAPRITAIDAENYPDIAVCR